MKPATLRTKIFLDGGDPDETKEIKELLGFLDGQTTNPTLVSKNPDAKKRIESGRKFSEEEILDFYKNVVRDISSLVPDGSVSIEVYADYGTPAETLFAQGREMFSWIPNAHVKYPTVAAGLEAAEKSVAEGMRVNMTLVFSQEQGAAVYAATKGAKKGDVFLSPFIGRLDDLGEDGMDLIKNTLALYEKGDGHVEVLTASVRSLDHFLGAIALGTDIITAPAKVLRQWAEKEKEIPSGDFVYKKADLKPIALEEIDLEKPWREYDIAHELTEQGVERFRDDWCALVAAETQ